MPGFGYGFFDIGMLIVAGITAVIAGLAAAFVKSTIASMSAVQNRSGLTGRDVALRILEANGIRDVRVESIQGFLTDHYSPAEKVLRLSPAIGEGRSISSLAVAAHEVGHAIQHARAYAPLAIRSAAVPFAQFGPPVAIYLLLPLGVMMQSAGLIKIGIALFAATVFFALVTLPVEFDASARALKQIESRGRAPGAP
jgi:Zn-dependent membrane protease YugP